MFASREEFAGASDLGKRVKSAELAPAFAGSTRTGIANKSDASLRTARRRATRLLLGRGMASVVWPGIVCIILRIGEICLVLMVLLVS
jgi:hypothetical protein